MYLLAGGRTRALGPRHESHKEAALAPMPDAARLQKEILKAGDRLVEALKLESGASARTSGSSLCGEHHHDVLGTKWRESRRAVKRAACDYLAAVAAYRRAVSHKTSDSDTDPE